MDVFLTRLPSLSSCGIVKRRVRGCIIDERQSIASQWPTLAAFNSKRKGFSVWDDDEDVVVVDE